MSLTRLSISLLFKNTLVCEDCATTEQVQTIMLPPPCFKEFHPAMLFDFMCYSLRSNCSSLVSSVHKTRLCHVVLEFVLMPFMSLCILLRQNEFHKSTFESKLKHLKSLYFYFKVLFIYLFLHFF